MNNANVIAVVRGFYASVLCVMVSAILGCASTDQPAAPMAIDSQEMVDCLLPGQIRQLDETVTYLTVRRPVRTTKEDCIGRGGTIQPSEGPTESSPAVGK